MQMAASQLGWLTNSDPRSLDRVAQPFGNVIVVNAMNAVDEYALIKQAAASIGLPVESVGFAVTRPTADSKMTFVTLWMEDATGIDVEVADGVVKKVRPLPIDLSQRIGAALVGAPGIVSVGVSHNPREVSFGLTKIALIAAAALGVGFFLGRR